MKPVEASTEKADVVTALRRRVRRTWPVFAHNATGRRVTGDADVAVSLTSYGDRLQWVHYAIESIVAGSVRPREFHLWLGSQLEGQSLTPTLQRLQRRGLSIGFFDDCGPHMKYYPYVARRERSVLPLVTADDDVLYPPDWLERLVLAHRREPQHVHCYRAKAIALDGARFGPYVQWPTVRHDRASVRNFATGVSGVIYPPSMVGALAAAGTGFKDCCARADDVWLHATALRSGHRVRQIDAEAGYFELVPRAQLVTLERGNVHGGGNDRQIAATYTPADIDRLARAD